MKFAIRISSIRRHASKQWRSCSADSDSKWADSEARWTLAGCTCSPSASSARVTGSWASQSIWRPGTSARSSRAIAMSRWAWPRPIGEQMNRARLSGIRPPVVEHLPLRLLQSRGRVPGRRAGIAKRARNSRESAYASHMLRVRVLGELALELDGTPLDPPASRRARSLLGLLAVDRRTHSRSQLAASFWPDVLDESARTSLRSALSSLRKAVGSDIDRYLISGRESVALAGGELVWVDLSEFEALLAAGRLEEALVLCRGELLAGLDDEWIHERRDEHHDRMAEAFAQLAADAEERGDLGEAVALTRRQVALDPLAEQPQRELIRRLGAAGDRPAALTAYRRLQDRLRSELGIAPSARTRELVESLRDSPEPESPAPAPRDSQPPPDEAPAARSAPRRPAGTVTLLFTDQVSSTETLERLGDDEAEFLRRTHFALLRDVASAHGGLEVKNLGDGLMVAFASAVDAVAAAIGIQQAVHRHAERERDSRLGVRVGLNVGEPIVDEDDYFGTPVVVAKRLCDAADSGQILAADIVRALVGTRGGFEFRPLPPVPLKGIADPVASCEIGWTPTAEQRIPLPPTVVGTEIGAFVGREDARARLDGHWREVLEGQRRVVLLAGDPGIGKTRLAAEFSRAAHEDGAAVLAGRCYEEMLLPHQPFVEALRHYVAGCPPAELTVQVATRRRELA